MRTIGSAQADISKALRPRQRRIDGQRREDSGIEDVQREAWRNC